MLLPCDSPYIRALTT